MHHFKLYTTNNVDIINDYEMNRIKKKDKDKTNDLIYNDVELKQ